MCKPVYVKFPDAQAKGCDVWVNPTHIIVVLPSPEATKTQCTLMLSSNLDSGIEVAMSAADAVEHLKTSIEESMTSGYYLSADREMYNTDAT